jgi:hypothetical protein
VGMMCSYQILWLMVWTMVDDYIRLEAGNDKNRYFL